MGGTFTTVLGGRARGGQRRYAIHVTRFAGEGPARMVVLHEDVTERWSAEEALRKSNKSLAEAMDELQRTQQEVIQQERLRALGQMASGIAHDLNNTLTPILGLTDLFIEFPAVLDDRDVLLEQLRTIHTASQDAASVIARLRDFYRPGNGHGVTHDVDLSLLAEQAIALTRPKWHDEALARGAVIRFAREYGEMPVLSANAAELREALANLIINAVDAMPRGGTILVRTAVRERTAEVVIGDTGAGMTEDVLRRCVEPFFSTKGEQGTGLGLSVVYGTAQRHNGSVHIASKPGEGTSVTLRLPLGTPAAPGQAQSVAPAARPTLRILLVDDEPVVRRVMAECLTRDGHHPTIAADGQEALSLLVKGPFDLMITDKAMPRMNGEDLALAARNIAPSMPIILLTGFGDLILSTGTKPRGVDEVVSKPATLRVLREAIARVAGH